jgi:hypothetical protein
LAKTRGFLSTEPVVFWGLLVFFVAVFYSFLNTTSGF